MAYYKPLDDAVTLYRKHNGITQEDLAKVMKMAPVTLARKLRGDAEFTLAEAAVLACMTGVSLDDVVKATS